MGGVGGGNGPARWPIEDGRDCLERGATCVELAATILELNKGGGNGPRESHGG